MSTRRSGLTWGAAVLKRRGLMAGVAALVGAGLAKLGTAERTEAAHNGSDEAIIHAGVFNTTTLRTFIDASISDGPVLQCRNQNTVTLANQDGLVGSTGATETLSAGVRGYASSATGQVFGVVGATESSTDSASGVKGVASTGITNGVWGQNFSSSTNATGVFGQTVSTTGITVGVWGRSESGSAFATGTFGHTSSGTGNTIGVWGRSESNAAGALGVYGEVFPNMPGTGVRGRAFQGTGVWGTASSGLGVLGQSNTGAGVFGDSNAAGGYGVYGRSTSGAAIFGVTSTGYAGSFTGPVVVQGSFTVTGAKSAAVKHPDGSLRRVYCQESTEAWFEDFGAATLTNGRAEIALDPDFDAVVKGDDYLVFLTPEGDSKGLFVSKKGPHRFVVEEQQGGKSTLPFSYRVVSRRKDTVGKRLERVDLKSAAPSIKLPDPIRPDGQTTIPAPTRPAAPQPSSGS